MNAAAQQVKSPAWMRLVLITAAIYNIVWGTWTILFPNAFFRLAGMEPLNHPQIWQCVGMIVGVYGVGYAIAARDPFRHWPIVLLGLLGKVLGPVGFVQAVWTGAFPWQAGFMILTNDLVWWLPFGAIVVQAGLFHHTTSYLREQPLSLSEALAAYNLPNGTSLMKASLERPLLLVFSRHYG